MPLLPSCVFGERLEPSVVCGAIILSVQAAAGVIVTCLGSSHEGERAEVESRGRTRAQCLPGDLLSQARPGLAVRG